MKKLLLLSMLMLISCKLNASENQDAEFICNNFIKKFEDVLGNHLENNHDNVNFLKKVLYNGGSMKKKSPIVLLETTVPRFKVPATFKLEKLENIEKVNIEYLLEQSKK